MTQNILIIEDEEKIARVISLELEYEGYQSDIAASGKEGLELFQKGNWDLILLDVMLPELNGMEVLRRIRSTDTYTPVILITARDSVVDKVNGLDQGANDYITKPFQIEELLARIRACLRTNAIYQKEEEEQLQAGDLTVNEKTRDVIRRGEAIELTPREFDLLVYLLRNKQQVLNREQILTNVWGFDYYGDTNVVDVYVRYLRRKVDYPFDTPLIHTVRGVGYTLKEQA
ncbi:response regulator transcription factor [Priestia endophytica]|jgi:DNA-binding response OmpR family regulator|uniref:DNA-binding response regulator, OmpR family, contains REC and winged-helix (WHTH) domain n=1 Tax=Priestia endophytica DSM 13796 TaxID=1121089 RepID=A0A1I6BMR3_9BACI|nr:response regulator transcription factor [Priestia endophytica]KAB2492487.1 response regulator transcription factor [Priestia endophytica]KYG35443.1 PhoB family transcriptional regulator [Priestia endophytica]MBG9810357.1 PhoB family transcriptional regulator [Priestia endophytica]SFQ82226.1 DNA-binding response regulator, OmpR family, contains REC and winged-helix (wHTH) domain [Priestia endophytica DSM 13796]